MMRSILLWLSQRQSLANFSRKNRIARGIASRFIAGDTIAEGVEAVADLASRGTAATLDLLGESVTKMEEADRAAAEYIEILQALHLAGVEVNASLKLTQMGFDIDEPACERNIRGILDVAKELDGFVRIDMEGSVHTQRTLDLFRRLHPAYGSHTGVVIQAALRRSTKDIEELISEQARVRLCKGAYLESAEVAFPDKSDVDAHYVRLMKALMKEGNYPGLATHDEVIIRQAQEFATSEGVDRDRFEFQMLHGIRRDLQEQLVADGWRLRVYVPFGTQWYPYMMRRLAERPENIGFLVRGVLKEKRRRS